LACPGDPPKVKGFDWVNCKKTWPALDLKRLPAKVVQQADGAPIGPVQIVHDQQ